MDINEQMEVKGFEFDVKEKGWKKNKIFVPTDMLIDHPYQSFIDKIAYFADNEFEFVSNEEKNVLCLSNGVVVIDFMQTLDLPIEKVKEEVKKALPVLN